ncbi:MAG: hypothetical protein IPK83_19910 [Planctomycetes bacterium]|nr:hypothetical protein [Planctomycetota bacterium]
MAFTGEGDGSCETPLEGCSTAICGCDACEGVEEPCMRCGATPAVIRFTDHYFYDGVRRIQEVRTLSGDPSRRVGGLTDDIVECAPSPGCAPPTVLNNQYIYGPDYVDELIAEVPRDLAYPVLIFQDANYNVAGVMDWEYPEIFTQYYYDPYGNILACGGLTKSLSAAHQGLFFDRFTGNPNAYVLQPFANDLVPFANAQGDIVHPVSFGVYQNRNRVYSPVLGRFLQRDPNETGMVLLTAAISNGVAPSILLSQFNANVLFSDGINLYSYVGANPLKRRDPLGLEAYVTAARPAGAYGAAAMGSLLIAMIMLHDAGIQALNQGVAAFQGGDFAFGESRFRFGESILLRVSLEAGNFMQRSLAEIVKQMEGQAANIAAHVHKILYGVGAATGGPDGPWKDKWLGDIRKALGELAKDLERVAKNWPNSKTYLNWKKYMDAVAEWCKNPFGGPPPVSPA